MVQLKLPRPAGIHTRMGSDVTILGRGAKPGWMKCCRRADKAVFEYHEIDLRAPGGLQEIREAADKAGVAPASAERKVA